MPDFFHKKPQLNKKDAPWFEEIVGSPPYHTTGLTCAYEVVEEWEDALDARAEKRKEAEKRLAEKEGRAEKTKQEEEEQQLERLDWERRRQHYLFPGSDRIYRYGSGIDTGVAAAARDTGMGAVATAIAELAAYLRDVGDYETWTALWMGGAGLRTHWHQVG